MSGSNALQFKVLVVGDRAMLGEPTRKAWHDAGVALEGPVAPEAVNQARLRDWVGVLIDITGFDDTLMALLETFNTLKVPYVFVVTETAPIEGPQPYVLGPATADIQTLLQALLDDGRAPPQPLS